MQKIMHMQSRVKFQPEGEMKRYKQERGEAARHMAQTEHVSLLQQWRQGIVLQREQELT